MNPWFDLGRFLLVTGLILALVGLGILAAGRLPWLGRLPGDILIQRKHVTFYFPLTTSLVLSVLLSLLFLFLSRR